MSLVLMVAALAAPSIAQPLPTASPESVGMSSERLQRIGEALQREIEQDRMPGAVVAIARRGKLVYYEAFGYLDKAAGIPMPKDGIFSIWSMTKPVVSVGALSLFERGELLVNDPVEKYLPELADRTVAIDGERLRTETATRQPTVRDLMRHTSGFTYRGQGRSPLHRLYPAVSPLNTDLTGSVFLQTLHDLPLHHQPGTTWDYSLGLDILGLIIERVSGLTLGEYLQDEIFEPLGMIDTFFSIPPSKEIRHAQVLPTDPLTGDPQRTTDHAPLNFECGGGCLASSALDYLAFAQMLLNKGTLDGVRILGTKTVEYMTADHVLSGIDLSRLHNYASLHDDGYGFGLGVAVRRETGSGGTMGSPGEFHWPGAHGTAFWVDPQEDLVIVFMAQTPGTIRRYNRQLVPALVYQAIVE